MAGCLRAVSDEGSSTQDVELMRRVARREPAAERELVVRVLPRVRRKAAVLLRGRDDDDASQVAMMQILASARSFAGRGSLEGWCDRIAIRTIVRMRRRSDAASSRIAAHVEPDEQPTQAQDVPLGGEVRRFLASLSEERYQVVVLRYLEDYSIDEIADATGVSRNTVKDRLRVALELLRKHARREEVIALHRRSPR